MILCDLQDYGLINLGNHKNCDVVYHDYGIKLN